MLTNNFKRNPLGINAANPRAFNRYGHILELIPAQQDHSACEYQWEMFVLAGNPNNHQTMPAIMKIFPKTVGFQTRIIVVSIKTVTYGLLQMGFIDLVVLMEYGSVLHVEKTRH